MSEVDFVAVHPNSSVTVTEYVPEDKLPKVPKVFPLDH